ncbi:thioesterase family protein [Jatrophihabitans sp.]|uniref:thioesterase family protein n=1 Tax=Jatrophihabitans sp. TaxID=1932789 RepID=UPI002C49E81E|nr:thioesterase family protein [Jatrophihabitans sp.]
MDTAFFAGLHTEVGGDAAAAELTGTVHSAAACGGPWSPDLQHGGPPSALLIRLAEQLAGAAAGRTDLVAVRIAAEFLAPVPVAPLAVSARVLRLARTAVLVSAELAADGRPCLQARIWLMAEQAGRLPGVPAPAGPQVPDPSECPDFGMDGFPYADHLEWRVVSGRARQPGPASVWVRPRVPLLPDEPVSTLQRLALIADSASGISSLLDWDAWSFANVDLDIHLVRRSAEDWVLMQATSALGAGVGLARSTLSDRSGLLGAGMQTLLVRSRRD